MEYPTPPLSHVEWEYIQGARHYTSPFPGVKADRINLLLALTLAGTIQQRQTWGWKTPSFGWASFEWASFVTFV